MTDVCNNLTPRWCVGGEFEISDLKLGSPKELGRLTHGLKGTWTASGRSALGLLLRHLRDRGIERVLLPSFLCKSLLLPIKALGVEYDFYPVDLDMVARPEPEKKAAVLVIHYFGWKNPGVEALSFEDESVLIEDTAQSTLSAIPFAPDSNRFIFASLRKFGPLPLGGWCSLEFGTKVGQQELENLMWRSIAARLARASYLRDPEAAANEEIEDFYLTAFRSTEAFLDANPLTNAIPDEALRIAAGIDWARVSRKRRENWILLDQILNDRVERLHSTLPEDVVPLGYVVRLPDRDRVRERLRQQRIFCPVHWPLPEDVDIHRFPEASALSQKCLTLPIDQRYGEGDMVRLADFLVDAL